MARIWISTATLEGFIDPSEKHSEIRVVRDFESLDFKAHSVHVHATGDVTGRARWNGDQIIYHSIQPHHKFGNLRGRVGMGEHLCKNSANKSRIHSPPQSASSFVTQKQTIQESGGKLLAGVEGFFCLLTEAKLSQSERSVDETRTPDPDAEAHTFFNADAFSICIGVLCAQAPVVFGV